MDGQRKIDRHTDNEEVIPLCIGMVMQATQKCYQSKCYANVFTFTQQAISSPVIWGFRRASVFTGDLKLLEKCCEITV